MRIMLVVRAVEKNTKIRPSLLMLSATPQAKAMVRLLEDLELDAGAYHMMPPLWLWVSGLTSGSAGGSARLSVGGWVGGSAGLSLGGWALVGNVSRTLYFHAASTFV